MENDKTIKFNPDEMGKVADEQFLKWIKQDRYTELLATIPTLCSIGVFNASLMNDAIFKFKRYEDSALSYTGIEKHLDDEVGGWDTVIRKEEYEKLFYNQQATMQATLSETIEEVATTTADNFASEIADKLEIADGKSVTAALNITMPAATVNDSLNIANNGAQVQKGEVGTTVNAKPENIARGGTATAQVDFAKLAVGTIVLHKTFGEGTITRVDSAGKYIRVRFAVGEKNFGNYAFDQGFLILK